MVDDCWQKVQFCWLSIWSFIWLSNSTNSVLLMLLRYPLKTYSFWSLIREKKWEVFIIFLKKWNTNLKTIQTNCLLDTFFFFFLQLTDIILFIHLKFIGKIVCLIGECFWSDLLYTLSNNWTPSKTCIVQKKKNCA